MNFGVLSSRKLQPGRGRKPTKGAFYTKRLEEQKREIAGLLEDLRGVMDASTPVILSSNRRILEKKVIEEYSWIPTETLPGIILESVQGIDLVVQKLGNLQGFLQGVLNKAAANITAAVEHLARRRGDPATDDARDAKLDKLRSKISSQEEEIKKLRQQQSQHALLQSQVQELQQQLQQMQKD